MKIPTNDNDPINDYLRGTCYGYDTITGSRFYTSSRINNLCVMDSGV